MLAGIVGIGLLSTRGVIWWAMAAPVVLAGSFGAGSGERDDPPRAWHAGFVAAVALVSVAVCARWFPYTSPARVPQRLLTNAPGALTAALAARLPAGDRVFNAQAWGSWLEYALPHNRVAVDSRLEVLPDTVWALYADVSHGREGWQAILDDWRVSAAILSPQQQSHLIERMERDPGWEVVRRDREGVVFAKRRE
jgi:hypothetical protein